MILRRAHDLRFPLQITYARSGTIAANLEQALVVFPCEIVKDDDVIGVRRVVVFAKRGIPRHDPKYIGRAPPQAFDSIRQITPSPAPPPSSACDGCGGLPRPPGCRDRRP